MTNHNAPRRPYGWMLAALILGAAFLITLVLLVVMSSSDDTLTEDEIRTILDDSQATQVAALRAEDVSEDQIRAIVDEAAATQAAVLRSENLTEDQIRTIVDDSAAAQIDALRAESLSEDDIRAIVDESYATQVAALRDETLTEDELRDIVADSVATQVAAALEANASDTVSADDVQDMVDSAVGTQVAMLVPTETPLPPTPTIIPAAHFEDDDAFRGPEDAPIVIVEFGDYQCGYCGRWYQTTLPQILEAYPDTVKFIYRDFPIFGEPSVLAAMATECAGEQDPAKFWDMHNRLYDRLTTQEEAELTVETMVRYAGEIGGLDTAAFETCLTDQRYLDEIINDFRAAEEYGMRGTPSFIINGTLYPIGAQSFDYFDALIQDELARLESGG